jgi:V8-like Glu-specific endopeptidase
LGKIRTALALSVLASTGVAAWGQDANQPVTSAGTEALAPLTDTDVIGYWTPERLASAVPMDFAREQTASPGILGFGMTFGALSVGEPVIGTSGLPGQEPTEVRGAAGVDQLLGEGRALAGAAPLLGAAPFTFSRYRLFPESPRDPDIMYRTFPYRLTGKLFFSIPGAGNFVCSASSVNSENRSVVWTAGHCVVSPTDSGPVWHTNVLFVPGYKAQGSCAATPYGCWTAKQLWSLGGWAFTGLFEYDHGAIVANLGGNGLPRKVGDRIGWLGFTANIPQDQHWHVHGYPAAAPFDGLHHEICTSQLAVTDLPTGIPFVDPETSGIGCDQTGGTSGGPWVINFSGVGGATNLLNGNNSYRYTGGGVNALRLYGPYFGAGAVALRDAAQAVPVP